MLVLTDALNVHTPLHIWPHPPTDQLLGMHALVGVWSFAAAVLLSAEAWKRVLHTTVSSSSITHTCTHRISTAEALMPLNMTAFLH